MKQPLKSLLRENTTLTICYIGIQESPSNFTQIFNTPWEDAVTGRNSKFCKTKIQCYWYIYKGVPFRNSDIQMVLLLVQKYFISFIIVTPFYFQQTSWIEHCATNIILRPKYKYKYIQLDIFFEWRYKYIWVVLSWEIQIYLDPIFQTNAIQI